MRRMARNGAASTRGGPSAFEALAVREDSCKTGCRAARELLQEDISATIDVAEKGQIEWVGRRLQTVGGEVADRVVAHDAEAREVQPLNSPNATSALCGSARPGAEFIVSSNACSSSAAPGRIVATKNGACGVTTSMKNRG